MNLIEFDKKIKQGGNKFKKEYINVIGTDEVGRGSIAGPVVACAVQIKKYFDELNLVNDSKKLTAKKRKELYDTLVNSEYINYSIKMKSAYEIDSSNILKMSLESMKEAVLELYDDLSLVLVDGNINIPFDLEQETVVKGDSKSISIATASIIAKVFRDEYMTSLYKETEDIYEFKKHKGYGTKLHYEKIDKYGPSKYHRKTFLKKYYENIKNTLF